MDATTTGTALGGLLRAAIRSELPDQGRDFDEWCGRVAVAFLATLVLCPCCIGSGTVLTDNRRADGQPSSAPCLECGGTGFAAKEAS